MTVAAATVAPIAVHTPARGGVAPEPIARGRTGIGVGEKGDESAGADPQFVGMGFQGGRAEGLSLRRADLRQ